MNKDEILEQARAMIRAEGTAITAVAAQLDDSFVETVNLVSDCTGCIYITGAGTSGTIARRTAHLLATCSMRAFYINAAEALHGPSAAVTAGDLIIILSKAGESAELNQFAASPKNAAPRSSPGQGTPAHPWAGSATWSYAPTLIRQAKAMACCPLAVRWPWARSVMLSP